ncbi:sugar phosphate isomerase/epimerase family protein [Cohnella luojiensis]|uniref:Sugar phosphate isomerase/epimerase n=1 Tax=Cohnella luojiensis TaxID=652876 RepID=A0A4Y8M225_9BACL|nr:TIM barrel protein [Cohnella luojiensis]TFE27817.1 sugar phosphate isomerase/epimerase [Cohnella luojiensis]
MKLKIFKALWGMERLPLEQQFKQISEAGYAGIESPMPEPANETLFRNLLAQYGLEYSAMVFTGGDHKQSFKEQVERAATFSAVMINAHSSKDDAPYEQQLDFYRHAVNVEREAGIPIAHETHRGRAMFTPWVTEQLLKDVPELSICADFSHWCCVCESLLEDQGPRMQIASKRAIHVHSRVGYQEGPQVNHPAAPEHAAALAAHSAWWRDIARSRRDQGAESLIIVPEFGPPGYLQTLPFTNVPVSDLWEVCLWMKGYLERHWDEWLA